MRTRNALPRNNDGVRRTTSPRGVLAFSAPPPEPINPIHSAIWPMSYVILNSVASTADQKPTAFVDGEISVTMTYLAQIEAELTVSNDYRVQVAQIYTTKTAGGADPNGQPKTWYDATYWRTVAQADGNIKDSSNTKKITVEFGVQVANIMYGMDADFNYRGFKMRGEYVTNSQHYMFPDGVPGTGYPEGDQSGQLARTGHRYSVQDNAWYITTQKDWKQFGFAGEMFKMGKFYRPYMDFFYPMAEDQGYGVGSINARNKTVRLPLVEDNDDDDQYPDTMVTQRTMGYRIFSTDDPDGVFPGNDEDFDGVADNNRNNNDRSSPP